MYSRQEREMILAEFHASGMSARRAARELPGFPSHRALYDWLKLEEEGKLTPPVLRVKGKADRPKHTRYDEKTKKEALRLIDLGVQPSIVAKRLNISSQSVIATWVRKARGEKPKSKLKPASLLTQEVVVSKKKAKKNKKVQAAEQPISGGWEEWAQDLPEDPEERAQAAERKLHELGVVLDVLKAPDPGSLSKAEKSQVTLTLQKRGQKLSKVCKDLGISRSTCYACKARQGRPDPYEQLKVRVQHIFEQSNRTYGSERIWAKLRQHNADYQPIKAKELKAGDMDSPVIVSEKVVRKVMHEMALEPVTAMPSKTRRYSSYAGELCKRPDNLTLQEDGTHNFRADQPFELVVTDVSEFSLNGFKCYLSPMLDCFDGDPIAWSISAHPDDDLCSSSLVAARIKAGKGFVAHSDGGSCYMSNVWQAICDVGGITRSMSRKGRSPDNARAEGFFGTLKREFYYNRNWAGVTFEQFVQELNAYITWYRDERIVKELNWKSIRTYREELGIAA